MAYNLIGKYFGELIVLEKSSLKNHAGRTLWLCLCSCGNEVLVYTHELTQKRTPLNSCRKCQWHIKEKNAYISWIGAKQRCNDTKHKDYPNYGGRGIIFEWKSFIDFFRDMGRPSVDLITGERLSLDRIDNDGNYCKENCRWATRSGQQLNKR